MAMKLKMSAVILYVKDMQGQVEFYRDRVGLKIAYPADAKDYSGCYWVEFETGACMLALHGGGKGRIGEDAPKIVFKVDDIHAAREELIGHGMKMGNVCEAGPGSQKCDASDPEGNRFSIVSSSK